MQNLIDAPELRRLLSYDPKTGDFRWRVSRGGGVRAGDLAGTLHSGGYWQIYVNNRLYLAHRLAWLYVYGKWPDKGIDHKNGIRTDNRICNLREATASQNGANKGRLTRNTSGFKGVSWISKDQNGAPIFRLMGSQFTSVILTTL